MENLCAVCGQPMKYIKAGVSKATGKPYNGFYACEDRSHKQPKQAYTGNNTPQSYQNAPTGNFKPNLPIVEPKREVNWDKISFGKCKHAFLVEAFKRGYNVGEEVAIEKEAERWASMSMRIFGQAEIKDFGYDEEVIDQFPF